MLNVQKNFYLFTYLLIFAKNLKQKQNAETNIKKN